MHSIKTVLLLTCALLAGMAKLSAEAGAIQVTLTPALGPQQSGRLIVFARQLTGDAAPDAEVDFDVSAPDPGWIAAREVTGLRAGEVARIDGENNCFPVALSSLPPGRYEWQAVLDRNRDYNYGGRAAGDLVSAVLTATWPGKIPALMLDHAVPEPDEAALIAQAPAERRAILTTWAPKLRPVQFQSKLMTAFCGAPTTIRGFVALPPGYEDSKERFPAVYCTIGFGNPFQSLCTKAATMMALMADGKAPPMIWVYLDYAIATGTHEFADSANNGPWGQALTTELIPALEAQYRMDGRAAGRFLTGHSSGGWASLWLQVRYPKLFGGSWPTSPDPCDFHDFFHVDLYRAGANLYHGADGAHYPLSRPKGNAPALTMEAYARSEDVIGPTGGQLSTYEWIFSPRGADGQPAPLFDRATGQVDPAVAAYWCDHYDIAHILSRDWSTLQPDLDGKIHLTVGAADSYYLDSPAHHLEEAMHRAGAKTDFRYLPGKGHNDLYLRGDDRNTLLKDIAWEIYAVARPGAKRPAN